MKTMYKGVLTVTAATLVASAAIIATNANTKDAAENEGKTEQQTAISTSDNKVVAEKVQQEIAKPESETKDKVSAESKDTKKEAQDDKAVITKDVETKDKEANYPPPPPSPFEGTKVKTDTTSVEVVNRPSAPTKPAIMEAPKAPVAPAVSKNDAPVPEAAKKEGHQADVKAPETPKMDIKVTDKVAVEKEKAVETPATEAKATPKMEMEKAVDVGVVAPEAPVKSKVAEVLEAPKNAVMPAIKDNPVADAVVKPKANISAPEMPKATELKTPEAPKKPENAGLKAPEAPKVQVHFPTPVELPKNESSTAKEQATPAPLPTNQEPKTMGYTQGNQQPMRMILPQGMVMPQGIPPQGMMMMPPGMIMQPQMINGQRMMMVPVYPMNMGRPAYPYNYQMPFPNMIPQGNFNPRQMMQPNLQLQQIPAGKVEK